MALGTRIKANNTNALNLTTSWTSSIVPNSNYIGFWDANVTGANTVALGAAMSWSGIGVNNPGGAVTIGTTTANLTLGADGIDMSSATQNLTINSPVRLVLGANQIWSVASGRTMAINSLVSGAFSLDFYTLVGTAVLTNANTYSGGTTIRGSTVRAGASTTGSVTNGPLGTGTITMTSGKLSSNNTTGRVLANALALNGTMTLGDATNTGAITISGTTTFTGTTSLTTPSTVALTGAITVNSGINVTINSDGGANGIFRGATTINGTLTVNNFNLFGYSTNASAATVTINTGGTLTNSTNGYLTTLGALNLAGGTLTSGAAQNVGFWTGAYIVRGTVTATDNSTISGFPIAVGSDTSPTGTINVASGKTLTISTQLDNTPNTAFNALQTTNLTKQTGTGTLTLTGANTFTGTVSVSAGTLNANSATALGADTSSGTVTSGATLSLGAALNYSTRTFTINGPGVLTGGALVHAFAGTSKIGAISLGAASYVRGTASGTSTLSSSITNGGFELTVGAASGNTLTLTGGISGLGGLTVGFYSSDTGTVALTTSNSYSGSTTLSTYGTLSLGNASALGTSTLIFNGGTLDASTTLTVANAITVSAAITLTGTAALTLSSAVALGASRTITVNGSTLTLSGVVSGTTFKLTKAGTGTLKLTNTNTYSGGSDLGAGTTQAGAVQALGSTGTVTLTTSGATLQTLTAGFVGQNGKLTVAALNNAAGGIIKIGG